MVADKLSTNTTNSILTKDTIRLKLKQFEGPFEILMYLIKEQEIDIFDIPIVTITDQYLEVLDLMKEEHIEIAGDFLVMAATLIHIKSRMLLPPDVEEEEEVEEEDPRLELVERLLEYRKFKELGAMLGSLEEKNSHYLPRKFPVYLEPTVEEEWVEVTLADLIKAIQRVLRFLVEPPVQTIDLERYSVEQKIAEIWERLKQEQAISSKDLFENCETVIERVCVILATLELCRQNRVLIHQSHPYGHFYLYLNPNLKENEIEHTEEMY